jgi:hypothetical protein
MATIFRPSFAARAVPMLALLGGIVGAVASCGQTLSIGGKTPTDIANERPVTITHEDCDVNSKTAQRADTNSDGKVDIISVMSGTREVCRALDLNMDGRIDRYVYFDSDGTTVRRMESDYDRDGRIDEVSIFKGGNIIRKDREMNLDGKVDTWDIYDGGKLVRRERDSDGDGRVDQWWTFPDPNNLSCPLVAIDKDGTGRPTPGSELDMCHPQGDDPANILATSSAGAMGSAAPTASAAPTVATSPAASGSAAPATSAGAAGAGGTP